MVERARQVPVISELRRAYLLGKKALPWKSWGVGKRAVASSSIKPASSATSAREPAAAVNAVKPAAMVNAAEPVGGYGSSAGEGGVLAHL